MNRGALVLDIVLAVTYLIVANPIATGIALHEWLGVGILLVFFVHTATHLDSAVSGISRIAKASKKAASIGRFALNVALALTLVICAVSGMFVSATVLPALGLVAPGGYYFWDPLHALFAKVLLALVVVHVALNWQRAVAFLRRRGALWR